MFLVGLFTHTRTQTQHHHDDGDDDDDDDDAVLPKRGTQRPTGCRFAVETVPKMRSRWKHWLGEEQRSEMKKCRSSVENGKERTNKWTSERKRRKICGTIRGRTRRLPAAALALTVALAPSNTERQTVDSTKAAGTAPLCPPFSSMCPSRALPLLSLSWAVPPSCYLACTYAFLRFFSFCLPVACTSPFSFFAVYFFSRFLLRGSPLSSSFSIRLCLPVNEVQRISCLFSSPRSGFAFVFISRRHTLLTRFFSLCAQFCWRINQATGQQPTSAKAGNRHNAPYQSYQMIGWPLANRPIASRFRSSGGTALSRTPTPATAEKIPGCFDKCINNSKNKFKNKKVSI